MAILDIFRKKKPKEKSVSFAQEPPKAILKAKAAEIKIKEKRTGRAFEFLKSPQISEKATELIKQNQYTFKILPEANKTEVKKAVEDLYGVDVLDVKIIKIPKKMRRVGRILGWRKGYQKAIVKIKEGQKIELMPR